MGEMGTESNHPSADANHDFLVNEADYTLWAANFGAPITSTVGSGATLHSQAIPEPASILVMVLGLLVAFGTRRIR
jgi:hypothetical protein